MENKTDYDDDIIKYNNDDDDYIYHKWRDAALFSIFHIRICAMAVSMAVASNKSSAHD